MGQFKNCTQEVHKTSHDIFPTCLQSLCEFSKRIIYYATKLAQILWTLYLLTLRVTSVTWEQPFLPHDYNSTVPGGAEWKPLCGILTLELKPEIDYLYRFTKEDVRQKFNNLRMLYKVSLAHNNTSGNAPASSGWTAPGVVMGQVVEGVGYH